MSLKALTVNLEIGQEIMIERKKATITKIEFHPLSGEVSLNTTLGPRKALTFNLCEKGLEDENNNGNLFDDLATGAVVARFLDDTVSNSFAVTFVRANEYTRTIKINVTLENIDLSILATDSFELGTYEDSVTY